MLLGVMTGSVGIVGGIWVLTRLLANSEPTYQGRILDEWRGQLTNSNSESAKAALAVVQDLIIPSLTGQMLHDTNDSSARLFLIEKLDSLPGVSVAFLSADSRRVRAVRDLASLGTLAMPGVPALLEAVRGPDESLCAEAATALAEIHADPEQAVPALLACMTDSRGNGRPEVVDALGEYGAAAKAAVPKLIGMLQDRSSKEIRFAVPQALKRIDPEAAAKAGVK
jgi:HEAT repeat protein